LKPKRLQPPPIPPLLPTPPLSPRLLSAHLSWPHAFQKVPYIEAAGNALVNHVLAPVLVSWSSSVTELLMRCKTRLEALDDSYLKTCRVMDWEGVYRIRDMLDAHGMGLLMPFAPPSFVTPEVRSLALSVVVVCVA
jgi:hypothetical protein